VIYGGFREDNNLLICVLYCLAYLLSWLVVLDCFLVVIRVAFRLLTDVIMSDHFTKRHECRLILVLHP